MVGEFRLSRRRARHGTGSDRRKTFIPSPSVGEGAVGPQVGELAGPIAPEPLPPAPAPEVGDLAAEGGDDDALDLFVEERERGEARNVQLAKGHSGKGKGKGKEARRSNAQKRSLHPANW
jgi:hypothetical protein